MMETKMQNEESKTETQLNERISLNVKEQFDLRERRLKIVCKILYVVVVLLLSSVTAAMHNMIQKEMVTYAVLISFFCIVRVGVISPLNGGNKQPNPADLKQPQRVKR